jgi:hypothetical protein
MSRRTLLPQPELKSLRLYQATGGTSRGCRSGRGRTKRNDLHQLRSPADRVDGVVALDRLHPARGLSSSSSSSSNKAASPEGAGLAALNRLLTPGNVTR